MTTMKSHADAGDRLVAFLVDDMVDDLVFRSSFWEVDYSVQASTIVSLRCCVGCSRSVRNPAS